MAPSVSVTLASRDESRVAGCVATATLDDAGAPGELALSVTQRQRKRCAEEWIVRTPTRSMLDLRIDVGDITVVGMVFGGDVSAQAEVGDVILVVDGATIVPSRRGAGERVEIKGEGGHALRLSSRVGDVRVKLTR